MIKKPLVILCTLHCLIPDRGIRKRSHSVPGAIGLDCCYLYIKKVLPNPINHKGTLLLIFFLLEEISKVSNISVSKGRVRDSGINGDTPATQSDSVCTYSYWG